MRLSVRGSFLIVYFTNLTVTVEVEAVLGLKRKTTGALLHNNVTAKGSHIDRDLSRGRSKSIFDSSIPLREQPKKKKEEETPSFACELLKYSLGHRWDDAISKFSRAELQG